MFGYYDVDYQFEQLFQAYMLKFKLIYLFIVQMIIKVPFFIQVFIKL